MKAFQKSYSFTFSLASLCLSMFFFVLAFSVLVAASRLSAKSDSLNVNMINCDLWSDGGCM